MKSLPQLWREKAIDNDVLFETFRYRIEAGYTLEEAADPKRGKKNIVLNRPEHFTLEWYKQQKADFRLDKEIQKELNVSHPVMKRWKNEIGAP